MGNIISKELLSQAMGYPLSKNIDECGITRVIGINESDGDGSLDLDFGYQGLESSYGRYINVHQLAHKCKTNAMLDGFFIKTWFDEITCWCEIYKNEELVKKFDIQDIEYVAIFKACQWLMDTKKELEC